MIQKSKTSDLESSDDRSVSGHGSALPTESALGEVEQRFATEHTTQVCCISFWSFGVWRYKLSDANVPVKLWSAVQTKYLEQNRTSYYKTVFIWKHCPEMSATASEIDETLQR